MSMKSGKNTILASLIIFVALAFVAGVIIAKKYNPQIFDDMPELTPPTTLKNEFLVNPINTPKAGAAKPKEEYSKIIADYAGRTIQFDQECRAFPSRAVFPVGTKIMFDNRGSLDREVSIGSHRSTIPAYDYMLYTLSSIGEISISCGPLANTATLLSQ